MGAAEEVETAEVTKLVEEVVLIVGVGSATLTVVDAVVIIVVPTVFVVEVVVTGVGGPLDGAPPREAEEAGGVPLACDFTASNRHCSQQRLLALRC